MLFPCGHVGSCMSCSKRLEHCPVCRVEVKNVVRVSCVMNSDESVDCAVCGEARDGLFYACGHVCFCYSCCKSVRECPVCQKKVLRRVRVFWS
jgi:hypothetical protein